MNDESIKNGNKIKKIYQEEEKYIEIKNIRFRKTSMMLDFTCIEILNKDKFEDFFEIIKIIKMKKLLFYIIKMEINGN